MIHGRVDNRATKNVKQRILDLESKLFEYHMQYATMLRSLMESNVRQAIGEKSKHFNFSIEGNGMNVAVKMTFADDVGKYLYYGTQPHKISTTGEKAMPIGGNLFAKEVNHPGTKPMKPVIDQAIAQAKSQTDAILGGFRRRV